MTGMTTARLDALCGGPPTKYVRCPHCKKPKGPYYSKSVALDAMCEHWSWQHATGPLVGVATDEKRRMS